MLISTRGRYALRFMISLSEHEDEFATNKDLKSVGVCRRPVTLTELAAEQEISEKYLESIVSDLTKSGLITGRRGKSGGYRLAHPASEYTVGKILRAAEGTIPTVACLSEDGTNECSRAPICKTLPLWERLDGIIGSILDGITLEDMKNGNIDEAIKASLRELYEK
ncbi:MAG: Rrf2 family transcriptional regulator [Clostridiales bacterium]|nr:Rrf2 family transcriptional regulator [Clostridiales bacterium]